LCEIPIDLRGDLVNPDFGDLYLTWASANFSTDPKYACSDTAYTRCVLTSSADSVRTATGVAQTAHTTLAAIKGNNRL